MKKSSIGIGLMGLGVVAGQVARVLTDANKLKLLSDSIGCPVSLRKIKVLEPDLSRPVAQEIDRQLLTTSEEEFFSTPDIDIVVEAIGGEYPPFDYLKRAIKSSRYVVTSNKELIAKHGIELRSLAREHNVGLYYEASAGGGVPLIAPFQRDLVANKIRSIHAIINGTTNYILTRMAREGVDFSSALAKAQELGYAEANPKNDVDGIDATYKLAILASLAFHCQIRPEDIYCEGISRLSKRDFEYARELGYAVKLLAISKQDDNSVQARVHPVFIPENSLLAKVDGVFNAIQVDGDLVGTLLFYGQGAGPLPTGSAVIGDIVSAARDVICGIAGTYSWKPEPGKNIQPITELETRYYIRIKGMDKPGVLAQISQVFGNNSINVHSVIQKETDEASGTAEIVIMTYPAIEKSIQQALVECEKLPVVRQIYNFVRVEDILQQ